MELNLHQLWKYFEKSPKQVAVYSKVLAEQKEIELNVSNKKMLSKHLKKACQTRWLSFNNAVKAAHEDLGSVLLTLSELSEDATALGLLKKLKTPEWVSTLYILTEILPVL